MHYTSTITKISLEELLEKKELLAKLTGAVEAPALATWRPMITVVVELGAVYAVAYDVVTS